MLAFESYVPFFTKSLLDVVAIAVYEIREIYHCFQPSSRFHKTDIHPLRSLKLTIGMMLSAFVPCKSILQLASVPKIRNTVTSLGFSWYLTCTIKHRELFVVITAISPVTVNFLSSFDLRFKQATPCSWIYKSDFCERRKWIGIQLQGSAACKMLSMAGIKILQISNVLSRFPECSGL